MKTQIKYMATLLGALMLLAGCSQNDEENGGGQGTLKMSFATTRTENESISSYNPSDHLIVRIYDSKSNLVRKYTSLTAIPSELELIAGTYTAKVELGEQAQNGAAFDKRFYKGEQEFTISAGNVTAVQVNCKIQNVIAQVKFDSTISKTFGTNFFAWVAAASAFDATKADAEEIPALKFTSDTTGYFILPANVTTLVWHFEGTPTAGGSAIVKEGTITNVAAGNKYAMTLKYSPDLPGYIQLFTIRVDETTEDHDDLIVFSPDPVIEGDGFDIDTAQGFIAGQTAAKTYKITTTAALKSVLVSLDGGAATDVTTTSLAGVTYTKVDDNNATLVVANSFLSSLTAGSHTVDIHVTDTGSAETIKNSQYLIQGLVPVTSASYNLWTNSVTLQAVVADSSITSVEFGLRLANGTWQTMAGTNSGNGIYTATFTPTWNQSTNASSLTVYSQTAGTGVSAGNSYETRAVIGSSTVTGTFTTPSGDTIYNKAMELWSTYTVTGSSATGGTVAFPNESSSTAFWVSGNNKQTTSLCTGSAVTGCNGTLCALLKPAVAYDAFAAGNLFTGSFDMGTGLLDTYGFARFGVKYTYSARPKALKVHFKATISNVTNTGDSSLSTSDKDPARIFVCITDWTGSHAVKSGLSHDVSTFWDPIKASSLSEGKILGYGSRTITESTTSWVTEEIPIYWYDKTTKPASSSYSLVISCATSAYGDYMAGSTGNELCVEDFEWVY